MRLVRRLPAERGARRVRRPSRAAWVLMVLCAWPTLHVLAYMLGTTIERLLAAGVYWAGFTFGALILLNLAFQLTRR